MEVVINSIDVQKAVMLEVVGETKETLVRDKRGRFVSGNRESVGNKGGRPRKITLEELLSNPSKMDEIVQKFEDGDYNAMMILSDLLEGKLK